MSNTLSELRGSKARAELDSRFYARFHALRAKRLPVESDLFETLASIHRRRRRAFDERFGPLGHRVLPPAALQFVNRCFEAAGAAVRDVVGPLDGTAASQRAQRIYDFRLGPRSRVIDLRACDVFEGVLPPLDPIFPLLLDPRRVGALSPAEAHHRKVGLCHMFLHRPQRSSYLFLHEMVVGALLGRCVGQTEIKPWTRLGFEPLDYYGTAARFIVELAETLDLPPGEVMALHFGDDAQIEAVLPGRHRDLMTVSSHIYFYMEMFLFYLQPESGVSEHILTLLLLFFAIPSLRRLEEDPRLTLRPDAGRVTDRLFFERLFVDDQSRVNEVDLARTLGGLVETLWRAPKRGRVRARARRPTG